MIRSVKLGHLVVAAMLGAAPTPVLAAQTGNTEIDAALKRKADAEAAVAAENARITELLVQDQAKLEQSLADNKKVQAAIRMPVPPPSSLPAADPATPAAEKEPATPEDTKAVASAAAKETVDRLSQQGLLDSNTNTQKFGGIDFSIGILFTHDVGDNDRVREIEVVNNIIRVKEQRNQDAGFALDLHYFFTPKSKFLGLENTRAWGSQPARSEWGVGPFIAVRPGSDEVIDAIGGGFMIGLRRAALAGDANRGNDSFNIGIGVMYDLGVRILGDGLKANMPLPAGDTIRYRKTSQTGLMIMSSYSF